MLRSVYCIGLAVIATSLTACGPGTGFTHQQTITPDNHPDVVNAITIDNTGSVPVLNNGSTTSVFYVWNNSNATIKGITYSAQVNLLQQQAQSATSATQKSVLATTSPNFLDSSSASLCANIPAHSSCPIIFTTPALATSTSQGSALIQASYLANGTVINFNSVISFAKIYYNPESGAIFNSGVEINGFGHQNGYATVYLYGSGQQQIYDITSITSDKPAVTIIQGNITGQQLQSSFVQAVEISSPTGVNNSSVAVESISVNAGITATLTATSAANGNTYSSSSNVGVAANASGAVLSIGLVPLLDSSLPNPGGEMYVTNSGNESATISSSVAETGITVTTDACSGTTLAPGGGCIISFSIVPLSNGQGNIIVNYNGGANPSVTGIITWYDAAGGAPLLYMLANVNPLIFNVGGNLSTTISITNIGGTNFTSLNVPVPVTITGNGTSAVNNDTCSNNALTIGQTCTYQVTVTDNQTNLNSQISTTINGSYLNNESLSATYSAAMILTYTANPALAVIAITPNPAIMTIIGNNSSTTTQTLTISNNGSATAAITSRGLNSNPEYMAATDGTPACGSSLSSGASCAVIITLGPTTASSIESGTAMYNVTYNGGITASSNINYTVQANSQAISLESPVVVGSSAGNGESIASPYIYSGATITAKTITLIVQNSGTNPILITGIQDNNSVFAWQLESGTNSSCYSTTSLAPGATCTLVYDNVLANNANGLSGSGGIGANYSENLSVPTIIFQDSVATGIQFQVQPSLPSEYANNLVYVTGLQATLVNSIKVQNQGTVNESVTVINSIANAVNYAIVTESSAMEDYFIGTPSASSGCSTPVSINGIMTQLCNLSPSASTRWADTQSVTYTIDPTLLNNVTNLTLDTAFSLNSNGQTVSMTPLAIATNLSESSQ